jgi:excisionase family DNA binding protein
MTHEELKRELREIKQAIRSLEQALSVIVVKQQPLLNTLETTKRLNCSYRKLQDLLAKGEIECVTVGGRRMFTEKNINDYLQGK